MLTLMSRAALFTKSEGENSPNVHQLMNGHTKRSLSVLFGCQKHKYLIGGVEEWLQHLSVIQNALNLPHTHTPRHTLTRLKQ